MQDEDLPLPQGHTEDGTFQFNQPVLHTLKNGDARNTVWKRAKTWEWTIYCRFLEKNFQPSQDALWFIAPLFAIDDYAKNDGPGEV